MDNDTQTPETVDDLEINLHTCEINLSTISSALRQTEAQSIVKNNVISSMASGLIPVPLFDIITLTNIQFHMIQSLAEHYDVPVDNINRSLIASLISGTLPVASMLALGSIIKSVPGIGSLAGSGSVLILSGATSYAVGQVFIKHFEEGGTLQDFNPSTAKKYFSDEFKKGKDMARELIQEMKNKKQDNLPASDLDNTTNDTGI